VSESEQRENETQRWESQLGVIFGLDLPSCAVQSRNDTIEGAHFGRAGQGPKMDPEDFDVARCGRLADLLVVGGGAYKYRLHLV
jgi:hypothetical protein